MPIVTLTSDWKKRYIPVKDSGDFFLSELRGIVSFGSREEAEELAGGDRDMSAECCEVSCDINGTDEYEKILGLWEFSEKVVRNMEVCGRAAAQYVFCDLWNYQKHKCSYLKDVLAAGGKLTAKDVGHTAAFTDAARETVLEAMEDEPVWDYVLGTVMSGYISWEELGEMAVKRLFCKENPESIITELCCCRSEKEVRNVLQSDDLRKCSGSGAGLCMDSVLGYYRLMREEGRISEREYMQMSGMWCDGYDLEPDAFEFYSGSLSDDTLKMIGAYRDMAREQLRAICRFFDVPEKNG